MHHPAMASPGRPLAAPGPVEGLAAPPRPGSCPEPREVAIVVAIVLVGLAVRWPELMTIPRFSDETRELMVALRIARGEALPLTNVTVHIGSLFNYLVAGAYLLLGPRIEAGRLVVMLGGALTLLPAYLLGRSIGGRAVGLLAALLLATSSTHIAVNSHIAYSHALTPLFSTSGLWLLHRAVSTLSGPSLLASGLAFGLALQTHPSALAIWPGLGLYLLWRGRGLRKTHWVLNAGTAGLLAVSNLVVFNLATGFRGIALAGERSNTYTGGELFSPDAWIGRLLGLLRALATSLGGIATRYPQPDVLLNPFVVAVAALTIAGLVLLCHRGEWLPLLTIVSGLLALSLLNGRFEPIIPRGRHFAPLLPLAYVALAVALGAVHRRAVGVGLRRWVVDAGALLVVVGLLAAPLVSLGDSYTEQNARADGNNRQVLAALDAIDGEGLLTNRVYLDDDLDGLLTMTGGRMLDHLRLFLGVRRQEFAVIDLERQRLPAERPRDSWRLVLRSTNLALAASQYDLEPLPGEPGPESPLRVFRVFRR